VVDADVLDLQNRIGQRAAGLGHARIRAALDPVIEQAVEAVDRDRRGVDDPAARAGTRTELDRGGRAGVGLHVAAGPDHLVTPVTALCSTVACRPSPSVMVKRTYLVPTYWKVKINVTPPPRIVLAPSSDQM